MSRALQPSTAMSCGADTTVFRVNRRGAGEGSVYKRSDGRWVGSASAGLSSTGKRRRIVVYGRTRAEARQKLAHVQRGLEDGLAVATGSFSESIHGAMADRCRDEHRPALGRVTATRRLFGNTSCPRSVTSLWLSPSDVQRLVNERLASGLSPRTVVYIHAVQRRAKAGTSMVTRWPQRGEPRRSAACTANGNPRDDTGRRPNLS